MYVVSVSLAFRTVNIALAVFAVSVTSPTLKPVLAVVIVVVSCFHATVGAVVTPDMVQVMGTFVVPLSTSAPVVVTPEAYSWFNRSGYFVIVWSYDMALFDNTEEGLQETLLCKYSTYAGLKIYAGKTKCMAVSKCASQRPYCRKVTLDISVEGLPIEESAILPISAQLSVQMGQ